MLILPKQSLLGSLNPPVLRFSSRLAGLFEYLKLCVPSMAHHLNVIPLSIVVANYLLNFLLGGTLTCVRVHRITCCRTGLFESTLAEIRIPDEPGGISTATLIASQIS